MALYSTEHRNYRMQCTRTLYEGGTLLVCKGVPQGVLTPPSASNLLSEHTITGGSEAGGVLEYTAANVTVDGSANNSGTATYLLVRDISGRHAAVYMIPDDATVIVNNGAATVQGQPVTVNSIRITEGNG